MSGSDGADVPGRTNTGVTVTDPETGETVSEGGLWERIAPQWVRDLEAVSGLLLAIGNNPARFVTGVLVSVIGATLYSVLIEGLAVGRYLVGLPVPATRFICTRPAGGTCDILSVSDVPGLIGGILGDAGGSIGATIAGVIATLINGVAGVPGPAGAVIVVAVSAAFTVGVVLLARVAIALLPMSLPKVGP